MAFLEFLLGPLGEVDPVGDEGVCIQIFGAGCGRGVERDEGELFFAGGLYVDGDVERGSVEAAESGEVPGGEVFPVVEAGVEAGGGCGGEGEEAFGGGALEGANYLFSAGVLGVEGGFDAW